jgi:hypothetical protein
MGKDGSYGHPMCLACNAKYIAEGLIEDLRYRRPVLSSNFENDWNMVKAGYVKVEALEKEMNNLFGDRHEYIEDEWMDAFLYIWQTELAADVVLPFYAKEDGTDQSDDWNVAADAAREWLKSRRCNGRELAERALPESRENAHGRQCDQSNSSLFLELLEITGTDVPDRARHFLEGFCNTPKYRIKGLLHMKKWMEFMAKPGPKVVFRNTVGDEREMPYPEESLKQATDNLTQIEQEIERLQALA